MATQLTAMSWRPNGKMTERGPNIDMWILLQPSNLITLARPLGVAVICYLLIQHPAMIRAGYWGVVLFLLFYWASDYVDGFVARRMNTVSEFGAKLDLLCDRLCDFLVVFTILVVFRLEYWLPVLFYMLARLAPEFLYFLYADAFAKSPLFKNWTRRAYKIYGEVFYLVRTVFFAAVMFSTPHWLISVLFVASNAIFLFDALLILKQYAERDRRSRSL